MRLIDADELKTHVFQPTGTVHESYIDSAPTVDAKVARHGKWKEANKKYPRYVCTACDHLYNNKTYKYCPNCGAKMDGKEDEGK